LNLDYLAEYKIPVKGIKNGKHTFDFEVNKRFFEETGGTEISDAALNVLVELTKSTLITVMNINISGTVSVKCDRCLDTFNLALSGNYELYVKFTEAEEDEDDKIIFVPNDTHEIDMSEYIREFIILSLPLQKVHPDDEEGYSTCNPEMLDLLENFLVDEEPQSDPRWDELKKFNKN